MFSFKKGYKSNGQFHGIYFENIGDFKKGYITREDLYVSNSDFISVYKNSDFIEFREVFVYTKDMLISKDDLMEWVNHYKNGNLIVLNEVTFKLVEKEVGDSMIKENIDHILDGEDIQFEALLENMEEVEYLEFKDEETGKVEQFVIGDTVYVEEVEPKDNYKFTEYIEQLYKRDNTLGQMELCIARDVQTKEFYVMGKGEGMEFSICFDESFIKDRLKESSFEKDDPVDAGKLLNDIAYEEIIVKDDLKYENTNNTIIYEDDFEFEM